MDEATLARIFEPFFTTKSAAQGAGLGLSIVHTTALTHHGAIRVSSQLGKGTKFELYFPVTTVEVSAPATDKHSAPLRGFGEKVALIDDERSIAELNRVMLSRFGYKPQILPNAFACQHAFQADPQAFDIIVTDQTMPGMTGLELAGALRQQGVEVPVLILSGYTNVLSPADIKALGSSAFLQKPYVFEDVLQAMRGLIKKKTATT